MEDDLQEIIQPIQVKTIEFLKMKDGLKTIQPNQVKTNLFLKMGDNTN